MASQSLGECETLLNYISFHDVTESECVIVFLIITLCGLRIRRIDVFLIITLFSGEQSN